MASTAPSTDEYVVTTEQVNTYDDTTKDFGSYQRGDTISLVPGDRNTKRLLDLGSIKLASEATDADVAAPVVPPGVPQGSSTDPADPAASSGTADPGGSAPPATS